MALLDTTRLGQPAVFADFISRGAYRLATVILDWNNARRTRAALLSLSSHELDDIGLGRGDVDEISRKTRF